MGKSALYHPSEFLTLPEFFKDKYGTTDCPPGHQGIWNVGTIKKLHDSFHFFANNFIYLTDKRGNTVLMKPFVGQAILRYTLDSQLRRELPGRICEIKARQLGWTMENIARTLHFCITDENRRGFILVDDEDVAAEQALRLGTMLNHLPGWIQPMRRIQNLKHLNFDNPNPKDRAKNRGLNSSVQITVPSSFRGVGGAICVIISEYAHMDPDRQIAVQAGLVSALPQTPETILIYDTTPNGFDESYWPMVQEAQEDNPKWVSRIENWRGELRAEDVLNGILGVPDVVEKGYPNQLAPALCPWRIHEEYSSRSKITPRGELRPMTKAQRGETESTLGKLSKYGGEEELELRDRFDVCLERIWWRRRKIDSYKMPGEEANLLAFRQEFFNTIDSAFTESGASPFDRECLDALSRMERNPAAIGLFRSEGEFDHHAQNQWQQIRLYAPPEPNERYTMGIDTDVSYESVDSDATVAQVVRFRDNKIVATYWAKVPSHELMKQFWCLYKWYNNCYYAIETAGMGYDLVRRCIDKGMSNVHYYKRYDADVPEPTKYPGWEANRFNRARMDQILMEMLCHRNRETNKPEPLFNIPDAQTIKEIKGLSRQPSGALKSSRGKDDTVDALCIALLIAEDPYSGLIRNKREREEQEKADFEKRFQYYIGHGQGGTRDRNHPSLASL